MILVLKRLVVAASSQPLQILPNPHAHILSRPLAVIPLSLVWCAINPVLLSQGVHPLQRCLARLALLRALVPAVGASGAVQIRGRVHAACWLVGGDGRELAHALASLCDYHGHGWSAVVGGVLHLARDLPQAAFPGVCGLEGPWLVLTRFATLLAQGLRPSGFSLLAHAAGCE